MTLGETLNLIQRNIITYIYSVYLIFGLTGCCLNILLLCRRQFRTVSCCIYFLTASVTMLINLAVGIGPTMYSLNNIDPVTTILAFCKCRIYILQSTSMMYRWALVVASFDRYAASSTSIRLRNFANLSHARRIVPILVCIWLILPLHGPIIYQIRFSQCGVFNNMPGALYHSIFTTVFGCILPVLFMILFAFLIYRNLVLKRQRLQTQSSHVSENLNEIQRLQRKRDQQVLIMLLIQVFVYMISILPLMIMNLYNAGAMSVPNKSTDRIAIERFVFMIVEVIVYCFPVVSFYLYALVSKIFREEFKQILYSLVTCKWYHHRRAVIRPVQTTTKLK